MANIAKIEEEWGGGAAVVVRGGGRTFRGIPGRVQHLFRHPHDNRFMIEMKKKPGAFSVGKGGPVAKVG